MNDYEPNWYPLPLPIKVSVEIIDDVPRFSEKTIPIVSLNTWLSLGSPLGYVIEDRWI